jgi:uncharacterized repeat protein (TIGR02543 family)
MRKGRIFLSVLLVLSLLVSSLGGRLPKASAATTVGCSYPYYYAPYDGTASTGTPLAYLVTLAGAAPSSSYYLNAYYYNGTNPSGAYLWNASTALWVATTSSGATSSSGHPLVVTDTSGNWSGWIFMKSRTDKDYIVAPNLRIRFYLSTLTTTNFTGTYNALNMMNMGTGTLPTWVTTQGGWISGTAYLADGTTPAQGKIVVVRDPSKVIPNDIIGMYVTEDNNVTDEYTATPGTYTVAAPVGTGYTVEIWNPLTNTIIGAQTTGVAVTAGGTTSGVVINGVAVVPVPGVATGMTATNGHGQISLTWTAPVNVGGSPIDGYNVYRGSSASTLGTTPLNGGVLVTGTTYLDASLGDGAHWFYAVKAHNSVGESALSAVADGTTFSVPSPVTTLAAVAGDGTVGLTWSASLGDPQGVSVVSYNVWRGTAAGSEDTVTPVNVAPISGLLFSDTTVTNGIPYYYRVTAVNEVGQTSVLSGNEVMATPHVTVTAPVIANLAPADLSFTDNVRPQISATYSDSGSPINVASVNLLVDSIDVTSQAIVTASGISYTPASDLTKSIHSVQLHVSNNAATPMGTTTVWTFTVGDYNIYFGGMHSHTNLSDGTGTPQQAYDSAKAAGADFMAVTDHSNWFDGDSATVAADLAGGPSTKWVTLKAAADANNNPGTFVAIAGFEMTWSGGPGHINTFNTVGYDTRTHTAMTLTAYYAQLALYPQSISQLNHPGTTFGTFDDFAHWTAEADAVVDLVEVGNGEGVVHQAGYFPSYQYYQMALDKGWHVAPSNNQDNHKGNWMFANDARTVVLAPVLTRDAIYEAIRQRHVYATEDKDLRVTYHLNDAVMGSSLDDPATLHFKITWSDAELTDTVSKISIIANGGVVVNSTTPGTSAGTWDFTLPSDPYTFYYVRFDQADTDVAVTAPVWTGDVVKVGVSKVEVSQDPQIVGTPVDFTATAYNNGSVAVTNATMEFFKDTIAPENKLGEVTALSIPASGTTTAKITWTPTEDGTWTIYARLTATVDGEVKTFFASTTFTAANPDEVTQVVIDGGHYNAYTTGYYAGNMKTLTAMIKAQKMMPVITPVDHVLTAADLQYAKILILNDPQSKPLPPKNYSAAEIQVIKDFVDAGGSLILTSRADYDELSVKSDLTAHSAYQGNVVLDAIGSNLRLNDDEVVDNTSNGGQAYRLYFDDYTGSKYHLTDNVLVGETYSFYSGCSVILRAGGSDANVDWLVKGHTTTASLDSDLAGDATPVTQGNVYGLAAEVLPGGGKVVVGGTAFFSDFETASADNAYSNKQIINNVLNWALLKTVAETRVDANTDGSPDLFGNRVTVEGRVTAQSKAVGPNTAFFDVIYVQDATGGLDVFGISTSAIPLGTLVRATGIVGQYEGDSQIHVLDESNDLSIIDSTPALVSPLPMSTGASMLETSEGWLVKVQGVVTSIVTTGGDNSIYVDDGTGVAKVYVNGYVGDGTDNVAMLGAWDPAITVGNWVSAIGLASQDASGHRLRVRNTAEIVRILPTYTLTVTPSPLAGGSIAESPDQLSYLPGTVLTLTAIPAVGYAFTGWSGDLTGTTNPVTITMNGNKTVTASFAVAPPRILSVSVTGSGFVVRSPNMSSYLSGTVVSLTATPLAGSMFTGWSGDLTGSTNPTTITMDANKTVTATFAPIPSYVLTTTASPSSSGTIGKSPNQSSYPSGTVVMLAAYPHAGYTFTGWSGDLTGTTNPTTITMDANKTVTATFAPVFSVSLSSGWNLISVSVPLPVASIPGLLFVYGYHDVWSWSVPMTLLPGEGYWVQVQNAVTVLLTGTPETAPVTLTYLAGWQLLGNPFDVPLPISNITNHELIITCYSYGPAWGILDPATDSLQPGKGYWIQLSAATTLTLTRP